MKIDIKDLIEDSSSYIGQKLWISDYRQDDLDKKPVRHIRPQQVLLRSNSEVPNKRIYYSDNHFVSFNKNGTISKSKIISIFDNTGFRWRTGIPVNVFDDEKECRASYVLQAGEIGHRVDIQIEEAQKYWIAVRNRIDKEIEDNK